MQLLSKDELAQAEEDAQLWRNHLQQLESSLAENVEPSQENKLKATA